MMLTLARRYDGANYPSYGYRSGAHWPIPLRIWVHEPRPATETIGSAIPSGSKGCRSSRSIESAPAKRETLNLRIKALQVVGDGESAADHGNKLLK